MGGESTEGSQRGLAIAILLVYVRIALTIAADSVDVAALRENVELETALDGRHLFDRRLKQGSEKPGRAHLTACCSTKRSDRFPLRSNGKETTEIKWWRL